MMSSYFPLRDAMEQLFASSFNAPQGFTEQMGFPTATVHATDDDVVVELAVPGGDAGCPDHLDNRRDGHHQR
jgi:HSP20 family molecular chaperone IbpA